MWLYGLRRASIMSFIIWPAASAAVHERIESLTGRVTRLCAGDVANGWRQRAMGDGHMPCVLSTCVRLQSPVPAAAPAAFHFHVNASFGSRATTISLFSLVDVGGIPFCVLRERAHATSERSSFSSE